MFQGENQCALKAGLAVINWGPPPPFPLFFSPSRLLSDRTLFSRSKLFSNVSAYSIPAINISMDDDLTAYRAQLIAAPTPPPPKRIHAGATNDVYNRLRVRWEEY